MERCRHRQRQRALGACGLEGFAGLPRRPCCRRSRSAGSLKLTASTTSPLAAHGGRLGATSYHFCSIQAQNRGHGARAHRHRLLHGCSAQAHQRRAWASVSTPDATNALYSPSEWPATAAGKAPPSARQTRHSRDARHQHHRLGVGGQGQRFLGAFVDQAAHVFAQGVRRLLQRLRTAGWSPQASSMPTACEPWPGKTNAKFFMPIRMGRQKQAQALIIKRKQLHF
jgi:hypothetical protein